jgi:hypothetical protein
MWKTQTCGSFAIAGSRSGASWILMVPLFPGAFGFAQAGLAPAVAKKIKPKLMRIARYPAALRIGSSALPFLRDGHQPSAREKQGSLHSFVGR